MKWWKLSAAVALFCVGFVGEVEAAISYVSAVRDTAGNGVAGAVVETSTGAAAVTDADGAFRLEGLPEGTPFSMKVDKQGYVTSWWPEQAGNSDMLLPTRYMTLFTSAEAADMGAVAGKGIIRGRTRDLLTDGNLEGVTVTAVDANNDTVTYPVTIDGSRYSIVGLEDGTEVVVSASMEGWTFPIRRCVAHADAITSASMRGRRLSFLPQNIGGGAADQDGAPLAGVTVRVTGVPEATAVTGSDGSFTISGVPGGIEYSLALSKAGFATTYTGNLTSTTEYVNTGSYWLYPLSLLRQWGVKPGKGVIRSRVSPVGRMGEYLVGAVVMASSLLHPDTPLTVTYPDSTSKSTGSTGRYMVLNAVEGDLVTVTAQKDGWTFPPRTFLIHGDSVMQSRLWGTVAPAGLKITPSTIDFGKVGIGRDSLPIRVTYKNTGSTPVTVLSVEGTKDDIERVSGTCPQSLPATLAGGASCTVTYVFRPTAEGSRGGVVTLTTDSTSTPVVTETYVAEGYIIPPPEVSPKTTSRSFGDKGGKGSIILIATGEGTQTASWTAFTEASWISLPRTSGNITLKKGKGSATVAYTVTANPTSSSRTATITVAEVKFTVTQAGAPCKISRIEPRGLNLGNGEQSAILTVTVPEGCTVTASDAADWLTATVNGKEVTIAAAANPSGKNRTAKISVTSGSSKKVITLLQKK